MLRWRVPSEMEMDAMKHTVRGALRSFGIRAHADGNRQNASSSPSQDLEEVPVEGGHARRSSFLCRVTAVGEDSHDQSDEESPERESNSEHEEEHKTSSKRVASAKAVGNGSEGGSSSGAVPSI